MTVPRIVLHVPHSAIVIPADIREQFVLPGAELEHELLRMTDWYTDELFAAPDARFLAVRYPVSRLVLDPERFADDAQEVMASRGMGVIYTRTSAQHPLRRDLSEVERTALLDRYYRPHHRLLTEACATALEAHGAAVVIDCHSFASRPLPYELDQGEDRPEICLGTDEFHTPSWLVDRAVALFEGAGLEVELDRPFAGALVPMEYYRTEPRVAALMIEVNRGLYMDETNGGRSAGFAAVKATLAQVLEELAEAHAREQGNS